MTDREILIEVLKTAPFEGKILDEWWFEEKIARIADHLIANGVTVRNKAHWIIHRSGKTNDAPKYAECSNCRVTGSPLWKSCPVCDSLMEE